MRARNLLERVDRRLDAVGQGDGDELDVAVDVPNREDTPSARLVVRIDRDTAIGVQANIQSFKRILRRKKLNLYDGKVCTELRPVCQRDLHLIPGETG